MHTRRMPCKAGVRLPQEKELPEVKKFYRVYGVTKSWTVLSDWTT